MKNSSTETPCHVARLAGAAASQSCADSAAAARVPGIDDVFQALQGATRLLAQAQATWLELAGGRRSPSGPASPVAAAQAWPADGEPRAPAPHRAGRRMQPDAQDGAAHGCGPENRPKRPSAQQRDRRVLVTVLFTDIVGSTHRAETLGDAKWHRLLKRHRSIVRRKLAAFGGCEIEVPGDAFLATFDSPSGAVKCAMAVRAASRALGLEIRAGLHAGECTVTAGRLVGIAVHIAARVVRRAEAGQILASSTVKDLAFGSNLRFSGETVHALKGLTEHWHLFALPDDGIDQGSGRQPVAPLHPHSVVRVQQVRN